MYKPASERGLGLSEDLRCKFSCNKTKVVQFSCVTDSRRRRSVMRSDPTAMVSSGNRDGKERGIGQLRREKKRLPYPNHHTPLRLPNNSL